MKDVIVIPKENKKVVAIVHELLNAKAALREFIAKGGKVTDFKPNTHSKK